MNFNANIYLKLLLEPLIMLFRLCFNFVVFVIIMLGFSFPSVAETQIEDFDPSTCDVLSTSFPLESGIHKTKAGTLVLTWLVYGEDTHSLPDNICTLSNLPDGATKQHLILEHEGRLNLARAIGDVEISLNCKSTNMDDCTVTETFNTDPCTAEFDQIFSCSYDAGVGEFDENATDFLLFGKILKK